MERKPMSQVDTQKLRYMLQMFNDEKEALEHTIRQVEKEIHYRENPESVKNHTDIYIDVF